MSNGYNNRASHYSATLRFWLTAGLPLRLLETQQGNPGRGKLTREPGADPIDWSGSRLGVQFRGAHCTVSVLRCQQPACRRRLVAGVKPVSRGPTYCRYKSYMTTQYPGYPRSHFQPHRLIRSMLAGWQVGSRTPAKARLPDSSSAWKRPKACTDFSIHGLHTWGLMSYCTPAVKLVQPASASQPNQVKARVKGALPALRGSFHPGSPGSRVTKPPPNWRT